MATITEDYVSFEVAKLLRDKGFDAECRYYYIQTGEMFEIDTRFHTVLITQELLNLQIVGEKEERCVAPTLQMAIKWLREVHNIFICIIPSEVGAGVMDYTYVLYKINAKDFHFEDLGIQGRAYTDKISFKNTCEAAIKYCLKNLI